MIHHVEGRLAEKPPGRLVVEIAGLGLELLVSEHTWCAAGVPGERAYLLTYLSVREDGWTVFGFANEEERALFRLLLGVQGVGPRLALTVLSGLSPERLRAAVMEGDVEALTSVSGVGKKTARRLILDLREKLGELPGAAEIPGLPGVPSSAPAQKDDAVDALVALGYSRTAASDAVRAARAAAGQEELPAEVVVKEALRIL